MADDVKNLFAEERKIRIVEYIQKHKKATVQELCEYFQVSSATIRNDLKDLGNRNHLVRTHGGAMVKSQTGYESDINQRDEKLPEKMRIAKAAVRLIENGDTIILDTGTTTFELARILTERKNLTVVTNDLRIALVLENYESINTIVMGGILRPHFHFTVGDAGRQMLSGLRVDKAFMGANSVSAKLGASTPDLSTAETKKAMISIANQVIVLFDSAKLNQSSFAQFAPTSEIDTIITDSIDGEDKALFEENDVEVIVAAG
jgi:DeoR family fructose operon transcriptional repressor